MEQAIKKPVGRPRMYDIPTIDKKTYMREYMRTYIYNNPDKQKQNCALKKVLRLKENVFETPQYFQPYIKDLEEMIEYLKQAPAPGQEK
jgi:hypothetical protein